MPLLQRTVATTGDTRQLKENSLYRVFGKVSKMKAKEYMEQLRHIKFLIKSKRDEIYSLREMSTSIEISCFDDIRVQTTKTTSRLEKIIYSYVDKEKELQAEIEKLAEKQFEILKTIEKLDVIDYDILHRHYLQDLKLQEIADVYFRTYSWVTTKHLKSLKNLQKILDES